jgi:hypothetical protein
MRVSALIATNKLVLMPRKTPAPASVQLPMPDLALKEISKSVHPQIVIQQIASPPHLPQDLARIAANGSAPIRARAQGHVSVKELLPAGAPSGLKTFANQTNCQNAHYKRTLGPSKLIQIMFEVVRMARFIASDPRFRTPYKSCPSWRSNIPS